VSAEFCVGMGF